MDSCCGLQQDLSSENNLKIVSHSKSYNLFSQLRYSNLIYVAFHHLSRSCRTCECSLLSFGLNMPIWMLSQDLATPEAFSRNPARVWEFYHYRRELALSKNPSAVHLAIAECEARLRKQGRSVVVITQCIDDLHRQAGSKHVLKIHGERQKQIMTVMLVITVELFDWKG